MNTYLCLQTFAWLCCDTSPTTVSAESKKPPCFLPPFTEVRDMSLFCVFTAKLFAVLPFGENTHTHKELWWIYLPPHIVMLLVKAHLQNGKKQLGMEHPQWESSQWECHLFGLRSSRSDGDSGTSYKQDTNQIIWHVSPSSACASTCKLLLIRGDQQQLFWE